MSKFTTPLKVEVLDDYKFKVIESFEYYVGNMDSDEVIIVPEGFITDFASIPRIFWSILPPHGRYAKAAVIHDYLYTNAIKNKKYADEVFKEAMKVLNVNDTVIFIMYKAVSWFGKGNYT